jgi:hypothetical protein
LYDVEHPEEAAERERKRMEEEERKEKEEQAGNKLKKQLYKRKAAGLAQKRTNKMESVCP